MATMVDDGVDAVATTSHGNDRSNAAVDAEQYEERSDQESFFQCVDGEFPSDEDDGGSLHGDDFRASFATAVGDPLPEFDQAELNDEDVDDEEDVSRYDYGMWMAAVDEPMSITERRCRLLQGMGLNSNRDFLRSRNPRSRFPPQLTRMATRRQLAGVRAVGGGDRPSTAMAAASLDIVKRQPNASLPRSRSDSRLASSRARAARRPPPPAASLRRVHSVPHSLHCSPVHTVLRHAAASTKDKGNVNCTSNVDVDGSRHGFKVKNLNDGMAQSTDGRPYYGVANEALTGGDEEVERFVGYPPLVKQIMRRSQSQQVPAGGAVAKGDVKPTKKKARWLKNIKLVATVAGFIHEKDRDGGGNVRDRSSRAPPPVSTKSASANASSMSATSTIDRLKVHHSGTSSKELTGLYLRQELRAHEGSIWTLKFNADGRLLASGGEDRTVRVWEVVDAHASSFAVVSTGQLPPLVSGSPKKVRRGKNSKSVLPEHVVVPETVFELAEKPCCVLEGHRDDVLDISWSKYQRLLSSSMDKTVRLWDTESKTCLKLFAHSDYVTCIQFNPADDGYFISGSLDCKVRIWSVDQRQVVDWSDLNDMVTAACYTPDGQAAIVGSHQGCCRFYKTRDCKLNQDAQIDMNISKKRKSHAKKITGFQFAPENPSEILVTSADSQIRVFNGITVLQKFKGFKNTSSQISASYTCDGRYVVCASEDSHVYIWRRAGAGAGTGAGGGISVKAKTWLTSRSYECFFCRDVSVAVPWPRSPSFRCGAAASSCHGRSSKKPASSIYGELLLSRRSKSGPITYPGGQVDLLSRGAASRPESGNAWGMVVVTASLGGEIRVYQNFGLPLGIRG